MLCLTWETIAFSALEEIGQLLDGSRKWENIIWLQFTRCSLSECFRLRDPRKSQQRKSYLSIQSQYEADTTKIYVNLPKYTFSSPESDSRFLLHFQMCLQAPSNLVFAQGGNHLAKPLAMGALPSPSESAQGSLIEVLRAVRSPRVLKLDIRMVPGG